MYYPRLAGALGVHGSGSSPPSGDPIDINDLVFHRPSSSSPP